MILLEKLTSIVYHFTTIDKMINILQSNIFKLSSKEKNTHNLELMNKLGYNYFFSTTTTRSAKTGFPLLCYSTNNFNERNSLVRIKLDGNKLNNSYKAKRVFLYKNKTHDDLKQGYKYIKDDILKHDHLEDRIITNKNIIENSKKYILEIDVIIKEINYAKKDEILLLKKLADENNIKINLYKNNFFEKFNNNDYKYSIKDINNFLQN